MRPRATAGTVPILTAALAAGLVAARTFGGPACGCTDTGRCAACVPACKATWDEAKTPGKPRYSLECEYACARGRDSWHAPEADCRCSPPCGRIYVKKRLYKEAGEEVSERVPKYEVVTVPAGGCDAPGCRHPRPSCWGTICDWLGW